MHTHNPHSKFLEAAENIAQLYRDDRKKNIISTSAWCCWSDKESLKEETISKKWKEYAKLLWGQLMKRKTHGMIF